MRRESHDEVAAAARRRLDLLSRELAGHGPSGREPPDPSEALPGRVIDDPGRHARRRGAGIPGWLVDRLPLGLRGRVALSGRHVLVVAALVAAGLAVAGWIWVRSSGHATPVPALTSGDASAYAVSSPAAPSAGGAPPSVGASPMAAGRNAAAPSGAAKVVVDVAGKVRRPGIVTLAAGARVVDALRAAGGVRRGVDLSGLNLARVLTDGEQIAVGVPATGPPAMSPSAGSNPSSAPGPTAVVHLNTATEAELETLPGVGPVTAQKILQWRGSHQAFTSVNELLEIDGIGDKTLAKLTPYVTL